MKITWLGQAGLLIETDGKKIIVDPYLSDNVKNYNPKNYRRLPVDESFLKIKPDIIAITHNHLDHLDTETLKYYLTPDYDGTVLSSTDSRNELMKNFPCDANYILFREGTTVCLGNTVFRAVKAEHSEPHAIGIIITAENKNYYITGDTLYNEDVFASLPDEKMFALFLPINGVGNNMNIREAQMFASRINAENTVPMHFGLFDSLNPGQFECPGRVIPEIYKEIVLK